MAEDTGGRGGAVRSHGTAAVVNRRDENPRKNHERVIDAGENHAACAALFIGGFMGMGNKFSMPGEAFTFSATEERLILDVDEDELKRIWGSPVRSH